MKKSNLKLFFLLSASVLPALAYGSSGMSDRYMTAFINTGALACVILIIETVLGLIYHYQLKSRKFGQWVRRSGDRITSFRMGALLMFWILFSFVSAPYLALLSAVTFGIIWLPVFLASCIFLFIRKIREKLISAQSISGMLLLSLLQIMGLIIYAPLSSMSFFRKIFFYDFGEIPELEFYIYAGSEAYRYACVTFVSCLIALLLPVICLSVRNLFHKRSEN